MKLERVHIALLAIMSVFTGVIAPVIVIEGRGIPLPMTNARELGVLLLLLLSMMFYFSMERKWKVYHFFAAIVTISLGWIGFEYLSANLGELTTGRIGKSMGWGWYFYAIGIGGFFAQGRKILQSHHGIEDIPEVLDHIIAILGTVTMLGLSAIIFFVSLYGGPPKVAPPVLSSLYSTGETIVLTGARLGPKLAEMPQKLEYDRKGDMLSFLEKTSNGYVYRHSAGTFTNTPYLSIHPLQKSKENITAIVVSKNEKLVIYGYTGESISDYKVGVNDSITQTSTGWTIWQDGDSFFLPYTGSIERYVVPQDNKDILWNAHDGEVTEVYKNMKKILSTTGSVIKLAISENAFDTIILVSIEEGKYSIYKNSTLLETKTIQGIEKSWQSNGTHYIFHEKKGNTYRIHFNGEILPRELEEVREIFLETQGGAYAYFARPIGERKWCLFTRYQGNLCGLEGYMNPRLGADNSSVIFAGYKDKKWGIYRNTENIVEDTGYQTVDNSKDYFFTDITNPKKYIFYVYDAKVKKYRIIKNGKYLEGLWDDVGLEVSFGFNNTIIMSLKKDGFWHIAEL